MSWLFSRALVEEYSEENCSDGEPSVQLSVMPTQHKFCRNDRMMEFSILSRFGLTYAVLTETRGAGLLTSFLEDFRARILVSQDQAPGSAAPGADYGRSLGELLAKFDQDTFSLKTLQLCLFGVGCESLQILPDSGILLNGDVYPLEKLARRMSEIGCGFLHGVPTPAKCGNYNRKGASKTSGDGLATFVKKHPFPTPTKHNAKECNSPSEAQLHTPTLAHVAGGKLNPMWVEWLMGWPLGWTDLQPLGTDKFQSWQQQHGGSLEGLFKKQSTMAAA